MMPNISSLVYKRVGAGGGHCDCQENKARLTTLLASRSNWNAW